MCLYTKHMTVWHVTPEYPDGHVYLTTAIFWGWPCHATVPTHFTLNSLLIDCSMENTDRSLGKGGIGEKKASERYCTPNHRRRNMFDTGGAKLQNLQTVKKQQLYLFFYRRCSGALQKN